MKKAGFNKYIKNNDGVAAVEFALVAPVLILFLVGIFDFGMLINQDMKLENTARSAAEYIVQGGDPDLIAEDIILLSNMDITDENIDDLDISAEYICKCRDGEEFECGTMACPDGDYERRFIDIVLTGGYSPFLPYPGIPDTVSLAGSVRMQMD